MNNYTYPYSSQKSVVENIVVTDRPDRDGLTTARRIKTIKRNLGGEGYEFAEVRKGFYKIRGKEVIYPVLWFYHKTDLNNHGNRLQKTVCVAPAERVE